MPNPAVRNAGPVVEKFASTGGRVLGYISAVLLVVLGVGLLASDARGNYALVLGCAAAVLLGWVTLIRPEAVAHEDGLVLRNMARDVFIPWGQIRRCRVSQTLQVVTDDTQFHGLGVTRSARSMIKGDRGGGQLQMPGGSVFGMGGSGRRGDSAIASPVSRRANQEATGGSYTDYVSSRILDLARRAKTPAEARPLVAWDAVAVAALTVAAICVVLMVV